MATGISNNLLKQLNLLRELSQISDKVEDISEFFNQVQQLVDNDILSQEEADSLLSEYKGFINELVDNIIADEENIADNIAQTSVIETNDKVKNIAITIAGTPVILPPPVTYFTENTTLLATESSITTQVNALINKIKGILT